MSETSFVDHYAVLGVAANAEPAEIKRAFMQLAMEHHPDVGGDTEIMQQLTAAYRTLLSPSSRRAYDMLHDFHVGHAQVQYHETSGVGQSSSIHDLSDDEIDTFLDELYAEYAMQPKQKQSVLAKLKNLL